MPSQTLRECPFCGAEAEVVEAPAIFEHPARFGVCCTVCECSTPWTDSRAEAVAAWNRRANKEEEGHA